MKQNILLNLNFEGFFPLLS